MKKYLLLLALFLSMHCFAQTVWHTSPEKWEMPRIYLTPWDTNFNTQLEISKTTLFQSNDTIFSPNGAYWFYTNTIGDFNGEHLSKIYIFNEREEFTVITISKLYQWGPNIVWINEKLMYINWWWGRILGGYCIFDVESGVFITKGMMNDGTFAWEQYQNTIIEE